MPPKLKTPKYNVGDIFEWNHDDTVVAQVIDINGIYYHYKFIKHDDKQFINAEQKFLYEFIDQVTVLVSRRPDAAKIWREVLNEQ